MSSQVPWGNIMTGKDCHFSQPTSVQIFFPLKQLGWFHYSLPLLWYRLFGLACEIHLSSTRRIVTSAGCNTSIFMLHSSSCWDHLPCAYYYLSFTPCCYRYLWPPESLILKSPWTTWAATAWPPVRSLPAGWPSCSLVLKRIKGATKGI